MENKGQMNNSRTRFMKKNLLSSSFGALSVATLLLSGASSMAIPNLQLDTEPGTYDPLTQTTIATSNPFTLRALLDGTTGLTRTYYISASIIPNPGQTTPNFGSFSVNGTSFSRSSGMQYGYAPVDSTLAKNDPGDLQKHGIYPTWFTELSF